MKEYGMSHPIAQAAQRLLAEVLVEEYSGWRLDERMMRMIDNEIDRFRDVMARELRIGLPRWCAKIAPGGLAIAPAPVTRATPGAGG